MRWHWPQKALSSSAESRPGVCGWNRAGSRACWAGTMAHLASDAWFEWYDRLIVVNSERPSGVAHEAAQYRR